MVDHHAKDNGNVGELLFYEGRSKYAHGQDKVWPAFVVLNIFYDPLPFIYVSLQVINSRYGNVIPLACFFKSLNRLVIGCNRLALNHNDGAFTGKYGKTMK